MAARCSTPSKRSSGVPRSGARTARSNLPPPPACAPSGDRVAVATTGDARGDGLLELDPVTGGERFLLAGSFGHPAWSPDGRWIAASGDTAQGSGLYLLD